MEKIYKSESIKEAEKISKKSKNPLIEKAFKELVKFVNTEYVQDFSRDEKYRKYGEIEDAKEIAMDKGIEIGELKKQQEIAKNMLKNNISLELIKACTDLSTEELEKLKEE